MRIGIYGLPTSGKSFVLEHIDFMESISGSAFLRQYDPEFDRQPEAIKNEGRKSIAKILSSKESFIMDGHYSFGKDIVFTEEDGRLYDTFIYLYVSPALLKKRMAESPRNQKYLVHDIEQWQQMEISGLRGFCHKADKDFYVIDNPPCFESEKVENILEFINAIIHGFSCKSFAFECTEMILKQTNSDIITLLDGDKTLTIEDTSNRVFGYQTHLYDGNFYTGYQSWKQFIEFTEYSIPDLKELPVHINNTVLSLATHAPFILTSGHPNVWNFISGTLGMRYFAGNQMAAETKFFITKYLQQVGKRVIAFGDGMNDYYMLREADEAYLIKKIDGTISRSLQKRDLEGIKIV